MRILSRRTRWLRPCFFRRALAWIRRGVFRKADDMLPPRAEGLRLHVGAGQVILDGYDNLDGYRNDERPDHFPTGVSKFVRAELLDQAYEPDSVAEIRCHHMFEHISILDLDRTLRGWNRILKLGGLVWIEVPDFAGCAGKILRCRREEAAEIYYRHIFGSQFGPGEFHCNGFTCRRLTRLLEDYGFAVKVAYVRWTRRGSVKPQMLYPSNPRLPDLTVKAIKVSGPSPSLAEAEWTHVAYRRHCPNPALTDPQGKAHGGSAAANSRPGGRVAPRGVGY